MTSNIELMMGGSNRGPVSEAFPIAQATGREPRLRATANWTPRLTVADLIRTHNRSNRVSR